jgi:hypothetical protein
MRYLIIMALSLSASFTSADAVDFLEVYPTPPGVRPSERYSISVRQKDMVYPSFVYYSTPLDNDASKAKSTRQGVITDINANEILRNFYFNGAEKDPDTEQSVAWTTFSFNGSVEIRIRNIKEAISSFKILPSHKGLAGEVKGNILTIKIDNPEKIAVVINGDYLNPLFIFADPPEAGVPSKTAPGTLVIRPGDDCRNMGDKVKSASVLWFEPGVHNIGVAFTVYSNQTVYIAGGAYLTGTIHGMMASNVSIRGRGVLAGDSISREQVYLMKSNPDNKVRVYERLKFHAINMLSEDNLTSWNSFADYPGKGSDNLYIEGITIASPRQFFIRAAGVPITVTNVKMLGSWPYNTDGFSGIGQANTTIYDCFFNCNDDAIYISPSYCNIHHCTFWQGNNGCVFQFSWGGAPTHHLGGYIHDCDIIHCGHVGEANNRMVIGSRKSGPGDISDIYFKNIRIEGPVWSLFRLETNGDGDLGSIYNIRFENITVNGPVINPSRIISSKGRSEGAVSSSWIRDITFKNVTINGKPLSRDDIEIGNFQVENIIVD